MTPTDLRACEQVLADLVQLGHRVDAELPGIKGQKLSRSDTYKQFKGKLESVSKAISAAQRKTDFDDPWLSPTLSEAIGHLNGDCGITRSLWALEEALEGVRTELKNLSK